MFGTQAVASLAAGPAVYALGWTGLNFATLPLIAGLTLLLLLPKFGSDLVLGEQDRNGFRRQREKQL